MAYIKIIPPEEASGELRDVYDEIAKKRGRVANVLRITSLYPPLTTTHLDLYMTIMFGRGGLSRKERELVATAVSWANGCAYCVTHHSEAHARYEKDSDLVDAVAADPTTAALRPRERALVDHALALTRHPGGMAEDHIDELRGAGVTDEDILGVVSVTAYFNFVNRLVMGLGCELEAGSDRKYASGRTRSG